jgi:hypothetical protein
MSQTRQNKMVCITNDEVYDLATHQARLADSANVVIPVANQAERDVLVPFSGMVAARADTNYNPEIYTSGGWRTVVETTTPVVTDPLWAFTGQLSRSTGVDGKMTVQLSEAMSRVSGSFTLATASYTVLIPNWIPVGWRPVSTVNFWGLLTSSGDAPLAQLWLRISTAGNLEARLDSGSLSVAAGNRFSLSTSWTTS